MEHKKALSASSIKSLETCSWVYWVQYEQKIPQRANEGALRGTIAHLVLELLLNKKHRHHYDNIINAESIGGSPAIERLVIKHLKKEKILSPDNFKLMGAMILVGLKHEFFGDGGAKVSEPEFRFEISNENPEYRIRGYIDKYLIYPDGKIKIVDYKSSKSKFSGDELEGNIQSLAYSLAGYKLLNAKDVIAEFVFLRYPKQPRQQVHPTKAQLEGFEHYLGYLYTLVKSFDKEKALNNMAAYSDKNRWLCKTGSWTCPYLKAFKYYALFNEDGTIGRTAMDKNELKQEPGQVMKTMYYEGCPAWIQSKSGEL